MLHPCRVLLAAILASGSHAAAQISEGGHIEGRVADLSGAQVPGALVRIVEPSSKKVIAYQTTDNEGRFRTGARLAPGSYLLLARMQGFRIRRLESVEVRPGETTTVGNILLDLASCDAPGIMCDDFGLGPPDRVLSRGEVEVNVNCGLDLRKNRSDCATQSKTIHLRVTRDATGVYFEALNRATIFVPTGPQECRTISRPQSRIQVDGLGIGDAICLRTHDGLISHIFPTEDIQPTSTRIQLWHVTRKR